MNKTMNVNPVPAGLWGQREVMRVGGFVLSYFLFLTLLIYAGKQFFPFDHRLLVSLAALSLTHCFLLRSPSRYALVLLIANYLAAARFYRWGQVYPLIAMFCLLAYLISHQGRARLGFWGFYLAMVLVGVAASAAHAHLVFNADLPSQLAGVQEYLGCAAAFMLAYKTTGENGTQDRALIACGWMAVITAVLSYVAISHPHFAKQVIPAVGKLVYGKEAQTPFGYMPKLAISVTGVTLMGFMGTAVGLSLWSNRKVRAWVGLLMTLSGAMTCLLTYRRSMILGFFITVTMVMLHYFGKSRKRGLGILVAMGLTVGALFYGLGFLQQHFGVEYWRVPRDEITLVGEIKTDRLYIWERSMADVQRSPWFGVGPLFYMEDEKDPKAKLMEEVFGEFGPGNTHNFVLYYLRTLGIPTGLLCTFLVLSLGVRLIVKAVIGRRREGFFAHSVLGSFFAALLFFGFFGDIQGSPHPHVLVWIMAGIAAALLRGGAMLRKVPATGSGSPASESLQ